MGIETRAITDDEFPSWSDSMDVGFFNPDKRDGGAFRRRLWSDEPVADRMVGGLEGGRMVGTLRTFATGLTVPGGAALPVGAVTSVSVQPTHRRRGILTGMIGECLRTSVELEEAASILIPAEWPIYGRFGYGVATEQMNIAVDAAVAKLLSPLPGTIEYISAERWAADMIPVYERVRAATPGAIQRQNWWWQLQAGLLRPEGKPEDKDTTFAVCRDEDGTVRGYAKYEIKDKDAWDGFRPRLRIEGTVLAETPQVRARLLRFLWEQDWIGTVSVDVQPIDDTWKLLLRDARAVSQTDRHDVLWVRLLDVASALSQRTYESEGRVVLAVTDDDRYAEGVYALDGGPTGATCTRTTETADLTLSVQALGSLYLGGYSATSLARVGQVAEERAGALALADRMFKTAVAPFAPTWF